MKNDRREFLKLSGRFALTALAAKHFYSYVGEGDAGNIETFGLQLYTLRDDMPKDPKGVLKQIASFGYKQIESYEGDLGMFWGMSNKDFKTYVDNLGLNLVSSHCDPFKDFQRKADEAAEIGMKYLIYNWPGKKVPMDEYKRLADLFNQWGEICKKSGLRFANHNYDKSFQLLDGQYPQDLLMKNTDPALVDFQMDIYWVVVGGADPVDWLKKYPNRFLLCHIKDRIKGATVREATCNIGEGEIDFPKILKVAKENGMKYFIVEQENYEGTTPLDAVRANAGYMKKLKI